MKLPMLYLCYSINDFYAREAGISMTGFFENNPDYEPEEVFFIDYGIHPVNKERLNGIAGRYGKHVTYLSGRPVTDEVKRQFPQYPAWKGSMAACIKPFIDKVMPDYVERLLFIDADTVVAASVSELMHIDMSGAALGVVPAAVDKKDFQKGKLKLENGNQVYFNSGVLLYNLPVWRSENCQQMITDVLKKNINLEWPDQNLLNNAIPERLLKLLPLKYNYVTHYYHPRQERGWLRRGNCYSEQEIDEATQHPAIIHYLGGWCFARPWYERCRSSHANEYYRYKALSPWKDAPLSPPYQKTHGPADLNSSVFYWLQTMFHMLSSYTLARWCNSAYKAFLWVNHKFIIKKTKEQEENEVPLG